MNKSKVGPRHKIETKSKSTNFTLLAIPDLKKFRITTHQ